MKLFVANVTTQRQIVNYRIDFTPDGQRLIGVVIPPRISPPIPPGQQIMLGDYDGMEPINSILRQLEPYGLVAEVDVPRLPRGKRITLVSAVGAPVKAETIRVVNDHNRMVKTTEGANRRKQAAIAMSNIVQQAVEASEVPAPMTEFDVGIEQDEQTPFGERVIEEGHIVPQRAGEVAASAQRGRGRGRGKGASAP